MELKRIISISLLILAAALVFAGAAKFFNKSIVGQSINQVNEAKIEGLHPEFAAYVSGYTGGFIHSTEGIKIKFTEAVADSGSVGEEIVPNPFNLNVACKAYWDDDRTIICKPEKAWDRNVIITGDFNLANYFNINNNDLKKFPIQAQILPQEAQFEFKRWIQDPNNPDAYSLEVGVSLLDGAEGATIETAFSSSLNGKKLSAKWEHKSLSEHIVVLSNVSRTNAENKLVLALDLEKLGGSDILGAEFNVPAENSFQCWKVSANREKGIVLSFTENVISADRLNGLFYSDDFTISGIEVIGTEVYLYGSFDEYIYSEIKVRADAAVQSTSGNDLGKITYLSTDLGGKLPAIKEEFSANSQFMYPISGSSKFCFAARGLKSAQLVVHEVEMSRIENSFSDSYSNLIELKGEEITRKVISLGTFSESRADGFNTYHINLNTLFTAKPGKGYQITLSFEETDMIEPCNTGLASIDPSKDPAFASTPNYYNYYDEEGIESAVVQCLRQKAGNYNNSISDLSLNSFFVKTNIGLIVKKLSDYKTAVYAIDIITGGPKSGVNVSLMSSGRKVLNTGSTNSEGMVIFTHTQTAALAKATDGTSISIISLTAGSSTLSLSDFNTTGSGGDSKSAYLFSERDMYRPGDSIHFGIILPPSSELNPEEQRLPIVLEMTDSKGSKVLSKVIAKNNTQMHRYSIATKASWPTGTYRSEVRIGSKTTYYNIKLETTKPNRLNINLNSQSDYLINQQANAFNLESSYLFGAIVTNGKALVTATATDINYHFDKYEDYFFFGQSEGKTENLVLYEGLLDNNGKANFNWTPNLKGKNPQLLKLSTTIFEESGEPSIDLSTKVVFPTANAIGIKLLKKSEYGQQNYTKTEPILFDYVNFTNGKIAEPSYSTVMRLYKQNQRSWYNGESGTYSEQNENLETLVFSASNQWKSKGTFSFDIPTQFQNGEYRVEFTNLEGTVYTSFLISINEYDYGSSTSNANHVGLRTDKETYTIDNDINLSFNSPKAGMALLTYERGNLLIGQKWMNVVAGNNKVTITPTPEMAPGIYLSVYVMQEYASTESITDMLVFGLKYIEIGNKGAKLVPEIKMPDKVLPEANTEITIKEKEGKPMTYMLAIVDEGLLNMTNFSSPNSYSYFYGRHFLGINSYENLSQFVNAKMSQFSNQTAGGSDMVALAENKAGMSDLESAGFRFKPLVKVLGPFNLSANETEKHSFNAEGYVGAVRVMVVAAKDRNFGAAEKLVIVSSDLMVQGSAPRLVGPTDAVKIPISLYGKKGIKNAKITFKVKGEGKLVGANSQNINFTNERAIAFLDVATTGKTGIIQLEAVATSGKWQHTWKVSLPVRSATSRQTMVNTLTVAPGETKTIQFSGLQPEGKPQIGLEINSLPKLQIEKHINYLLHYPYGCLEQTVSAAFPQIYLSKITKLDNIAKNKAAYHVNEAIGRLNSFRSNVTDGFSYWPGTSQIDPWANLYALHFLQVAKAEGFVVPESYDELMKNYLQGLQKSINTGSAEGQTFLAYAAYVASLSIDNNYDSDNELSNTFAIPTTNGLIQRSELCEEARMLCALTLKNYQVASKVIDTENSSKTNGATFTNPLRTTAMKLMVSCKLNKNSNQSFEIASLLVNEMNISGWYNTQTVSWSMIALAAYAEKYGAGNATATVSIANKPAENITLNGLSWKQNLAPRNAAKGITIKNTGKGTLYINAITNTLPKPGEEKNINSQMDISIAYSDLSGNPLNPNNLPSGTSFKAVIKVKQLAKVNSDHAAVNFRLPGGWELDNARLANDTENPFPNTEFTDFRDDRMSIFLGLRAGEVRVFEIGLKATYAGKYFMPGIQAEDMYQTTIRTAKAGVYVVVTK